MLGATFSNLHGRSLCTVKEFVNTPSSPSDIARLRREHISKAFNRTLDRFDVLEGHTGCVNALNWAQQGSILISGGDDTTVRIWQVDPTQHERAYPLSCSTVINTGHRANIFNAKMLPHSCRVATAAGDAQIRVFDLRTTLTSAYPGKTEVHSDELRVATIKCHRDSVKKIIADHSSDLFLTVSEDGTVRQHDLRVAHDCRSRSCPAPLIDVGYPLLTMSLSPLTPYQLVVAGEAPHGYLFDRRHLRRTIESTWGKVPKAGQGITTCVRKFGRPPQTNARRLPGHHITSARMSDSNGYELLLSFSHDGVYLYSIHDDPDDNAKISEAETPHSSPEFTGVDPDNFGEDKADFASVETVLPRRRFIGARNIATVKDVNFLGPDDEWVVSGSDDGNFFVWNKNNGKLSGIFEGDSAVVNVVEGHPRIPVVAVSGIDNTVKMFSPTSLSSSFSRMDRAEEIMENNRRPYSSPILSLASLASLQILAGMRNAAGNDDEAEIRPVECTHQ